MKTSGLERYQQLAQLGTFSRAGLTQALDVPAKSAESVINKFLVEGLIKRVRHDFYVVVSLENPGQTILSPYQIASRLTPDATLINHTAFEILGSYNQVYYELYIASQKQIDDFAFNGYRYRFFRPKVALKTLERNGVRCTTWEQTVIDSINDVEKLTGFEEVINCLEGTPPLNWRELLEVLAAYDSGLLYQKTGFILEGLNQTLKLPAEFFFEVEKHLPVRRNYLTNDKSVYSDKWRLYGPDIGKILNQGIEEAFDG